MDFSEKPVFWKALKPPLKDKCGELLVSLCYHPTNSTLTLIALKARNLKAKDINGKSGKFLVDPNFSVPFRLDGMFLQIPTSKCGCTLGTSEWRSARRPSTSAPWSRCLTRRSPSTCRGRRSANARSTSASWTLTTSAVMSSSDAFHSPVSYWVLIHSALWPPPTHQKFIAGPENSMIDAPTLWVCARGSIGPAPIQ